METKFIPSIFNYCDRWCEKCSFTSRCRTYERTSKLTPEEQDPDNDACWDKIKSDMENALSMLDKMAEEQGLDLDASSPEEEKAWKEEQDELEELISNHELTKFCDEYWKTCQVFFDDSSKQTQEARSLAKQVFLGLRTKEDGLKIATDITENMEIVQWYMFFIATKFKRALDGKFEASREQDDETELYDSNGSAKIAIIAVDKSIDAWKKIYELRETAEDAGLKCLGMLTAIKKMALNEFPKAMNFVRPGFDAEN